MIGIDISLVKCIFLVLRVSKNIRLKESFMFLRNLGFIQVRLII